MVHTRGALEAGARGADAGQIVLGVQALGLARGTQVEIKAHGALEARANNASLAAIACHTNVNDWRGPSVLGRRRAAVRASTGARGSASGSGGSG